MAVAVNRDKPDSWKDDISRSVDMYNEWFLGFAPEAFRTTRVQATERVVESLRATDNLREITAAVLKESPSVLATLRMSTCPPLAVDRPIGLSGASKNLVKTMEERRILPPRMGSEDLDRDLGKIVEVLNRMADTEIFPWLHSSATPGPTQVHRAATIVADRLCGSVANPFLRNEQEERQLSAIRDWLFGRGYRLASKGVSFGQMESGTFSFRTNVPVGIDHTAATVNIVVDVAIQPKRAQGGELPLLVEAKSAGDSTNVNKRRKEEGMKMRQLSQTYGQGVSFVLFLGGYFDIGYLKYEAAEGMDWVWEHRIEDFARFGLL